MKKYYLFFASLLFSATATLAQVKIDSVNKNNILCVGSADVACETVATIKDMRFIRTENQLALISSKDLVSTYYFIYDSNNKLITQGTFKKRKAGEYILIDLGPIVSHNPYSIIFSDKRLSVVVK